MKMQLGNNLHASGKYTQLWPGGYFRMTKIGIAMIAMTYVRLYYFLRQPLFAFFIFRLFNHRCIFDGISKIKQSAQHQYRYNN